MSVRRAVAVLAAVSTVFSLMWLPAAGLASAAEPVSPARLTAKAAHQIDPGPRTAASVGMPSNSIQEPSVAPAGGVEITGHGSGHGRGLSQYGAYGYAMEGWSFRQIIAHYYGGAVLAQRPGASGSALIRVRLLGQDGRDLIVTSGASFVAGGVLMKAGSTARLHLEPGGTITLYGRAGTCTGTETKAKVRVTGSVMSTVSLPGNDLTKMLTLCGTVRRSYHGLMTLLSDGGAARTVNTVYLRDYLDGVVPRESYAGWGSDGGGKGMQALDAQAIASRSYALAENRWSYASTCDDTHCQVYGGAGLNGSVIEDPRSNAAVAATDGLALMQNGRYAYAEFGTASGGYTAPGDFTAVPDPGDAVAINPYHNWTVSRNLAPLGARYGVGTLTGLDVIQRNGLGADGGRVLQVRVSGSAGSAVVSGHSVALALDLPSDWYVFHTVSHGSLLALDASSGARLSGVLYAIYGSRCTAGRQLSVGRTGSSGTFPIAALAGSYCAVMLSAPAGYRVDSRPVAFSVGFGEGFTVTARVPPAASHGTVMVRDAATGKAVPDARVSVYGAACTAGRPMSTMTTRADGTIPVAAYPGQYCAVLQDSPAGYTPNDVPTRFTVVSQSAFRATITATRAR